MSSSYDRLVVLRALASLDRPSISTTQYHEPWQIARKTPEFMLGTGLQPSKRQPFGERRVRKILAELVDDGLVGRRRTWEGGHRFRLTALGKADLGA